MPRNTIETITKRINQTPEYIFEANTPDHYVIGLLQLILNDFIRHDKCGFADTNSDWHVS